MSYMKSFIMAALLLLYSADLWAAEVDAASAQSLAAGFLQSQPSGKLMAPGRINLQLAHTEPMKSEAGSVAYYVFNGEDGNAFVIVSGDDRAEQILAYGDQALDMSSIPANLRWWLDQYKAQIQWLAEQDESTLKLRKQAPASDVVIAPLLTSIWHQSTPFNDQCPEVDGELSATGCVATSMAQVMHFWKYPAELPPLPGYVTGTHQIQVPPLPGTQLDWDNIIDNYFWEYNEAQATAVATLLRYCGQGCYMDYSPTGSGAWQEAQLMALKRFGYNRDAQCLNRDECDDEQWNAMLMEELMAGRPVLYTGAGYEGAHAFVLDGYSNGRYHANWGWGGGNGYYSLDALGGKDWAFDFYQTMQYHIFPDPEGSQVPFYDFEENGLCFKRVGDAVEVVRRDIMPNCYSGSIVIPETVTHGGETLAVTAIAPNAFMDCMGLTEVTVPASVTDIGPLAFNNCQALKTVRIHGKSTSIGKNAFAECSALSEVYVDDILSWLTMTFVSNASSPLSYGAMLYDKNGEELTDVVIPASLGSVPDRAFTFYEHLRSVVIEEGMTSIGSSAFYYCEGLTSVTLPQSLRSIGDNAFCFCLTLRDLTLPQSLQSIDVEAFYACDGLTHLEIPGSIVELGDAAFCECFGLTQVTLNPGLERLGNYTFNYCIALESVSLPATVSSVGFAAFAGCSSMTSVSLNDNLKDIEDYAFYGCTSLTELVIPASVNCIGYGAFMGCSSLNTVAMPIDDAQVGESAFDSCTGLSRVDIDDLASWCGITFANDEANPLYCAHHLYMNGEEVHDLAIPAGVTAIPDYAFVRCEGLTSLTMSAGVETIGNQAFTGCKQMSTATMGEGVRTIGEKAFSSCSKLTDFTFGSRVDSVGMLAFDSSSALTTITSRAVTPPALRGKSTFPDKVYKNATVRVPRQSVGEYQETVVWKRFNIVGVNFRAEAADVNGDGEVSVADVNCIINALMCGTASLSLDVDGDGEVTIADVNVVIDVILTN